jgi:hypothetical protein
MNTALAAKFNKSFQAAAVKYDASLAAKPEKTLHPETEAALSSVVANFAMPAGGIDAMTITACAAWPRINRLINVGLKILAWMPSYKADVALAKGWLEAFNTDIVPEICGK